MRSADTASSEATFFDDITPYLSGADAELLRRNSKAALYEPLVGAAAHALAAVLDRVRHGALPSSAGRDASVQQAATLAASLAARPDAWPEFRSRLHRRGGGGDEEVDSRGNRAGLDGEMALRSVLDPDAGCVRPGGRGRARPGDRRSGLPRASCAVDRPDAAGDRIDASGGLALTGMRAASRCSSPCPCCGSADCRWRSWCCFGFTHGSGGRCMSSCSTACWRSATCCVHGRRIERALRTRRSRGGESAPCRSWWAAIPIAWTTRPAGARPIESLSENLTDGFTSPLFWYAAGGVPGLVLFKVVSTMDSMVGYKTPRYLRFGWCGARLDDVMNYVPARLTFAAARRGRRRACPRCSGRKAVRVGLVAACVAAGPELGMERGGDGRRASSAGSSVRSG